MSSFDLPIWAQDPDYPAATDRGLIDVLWDEAVVIEGFEVTPRSAGGPNLSVDVSAGVAVVVGDDSAGQGKYLVRARASGNFVIAGPPGSGQRKDLVVVRVNDPQAGGGSAPPYDEVEVIQGTPGAVPSAEPALPDTAEPLALVTMNAGDASVQAANITDRRPTGPASQTIIVSDQPPSGGRDGDVWIVI